ncbi:hypothetical protein P153DRAFT_100213 [Dothidotthia symphoricarpi CBS 119687]|uniref:Uncharacterized protein n=1 Tax=Dothidotthia symphoricarpi CBS 119687 TaxID=1392245 RepID=A0A6A6ASE6_9PLEO|nr:uncharacterized protein P153DRAFT_100213 [Dothidotthia symphoricarpi CBS 119687]KAF2133864.1 hypothetical protein P153DRAFT_100213 [Dothidotthia symphoricarpi CBS 119687]
MSEFRLALVRKGHRRIDVDNLYSKAKARLENERQRPTGVDIVDMIMDGALTHQATHRRPPSRPRQSAPYEFQFSRSSLTVHVGANSRVTVRNVPMFLHVPAQALRQAKSDLQRLYTQEATAYAAAQFAVSNIQAIRASRGRAERKYVNCLIRYLRGTQRISSLQANQLQHNFTREKSAVLGVQNRDYLLGMFPRELD